MRIFQGIEAFGAMTAVITESGERLSYRRFAARCDDAVKDLSIDSRVVAIECDNSLDALCSYVGALRNGLVVMPLDPAMPDLSRQRLFALFRVDACWRARIGGWTHLPTSVRGLPAPYPELALLMSTSGSTGSPKMVRLSHRNLIANAASIAAYLDLSQDDRPITSLPMHYSYGMSVVNSHLMVGAAILLTRQSLMARGFWEFFRAEHATSLAGVPTSYEMLHRLNLEEMVIPSLRTLTQAGGRLHPATAARTARYATRTGRRFFIMYGQTEASPRIAWLPPDRVLDKPDSIGVAVPGGRLTLLDAAGRLIEESEVEGELIYEGPNVMLGYASGAEDLALGDVNLGVLRTGDLARRDDEGHFRITGRLQRFLKIFGKRVNLDDVEAFVGGLGFECAATGRDDWLVLALRQPKRPATEVANAVQGCFHVHHSAVRIVEIDEFPRSAAGKLLYGELLRDLTSRIK